MLMKKSIVIGLLVAAALTLAACSKGNTTSGVGQGGQQTSNATNNGGGVGTGGAGGGGSAGINTLPEGDGFVPKHCAVIGYTPAEVPKLVGCSVDSFNKCKCYDPTNPAQIN